jgi:hypothetical protein
MMMPMNPKIELMSRRKRIKASLKKMACFRLYYPPPLASMRVRLIRGRG